MAERIRPRSDRSVQPQQSWPLSRTPFFSFNQQQMVTAYPITGTGTPAGTAGAIVEHGHALHAKPDDWFDVLGSTLGLYGTGQMVYNAPYGNAAYCYFDYQSYGTLAQPTNLAIVGLVASNSAARASSSPLATPPSRARRPST